jgi:NADH-quinone oxidoreductase subunit N
VNFYELFDRTNANSLVHQVLDVSVPAFWPELTLCVTIVLMLLSRLPSWGRKVNAFYIALAGSSAALYFAAPWQLLGLGTERAAAFANGPVSLFDGMLVYDEMTVFFRGVLMLFAVLFVIMTRLTGIPDREDGPDFYTLVLGGLLGMCIMASANHMMTVFLGIEMASVPSYALAGMLKGRRKSSEAALKYSIYGAGAAGVMLYGISLLCGALGSAHLPTMAAQLAALSPEAWADRQTVLIIGGLMVSVGLAFKLSAVPFHFWCPDVFEGASAEIAGYLSVASKAAALALLIRVVVGFGQVPTPVSVNEPAAEPTAVAARIPASVISTDGKTPVRPAVDTQPASPLATDSADSSRGEPGTSAALAPVRKYLVGLLSLFAAVTCTFGNLAAFGQTNIKRLLAYSTIAHAGYMLMPVAAAVQLMGTNAAAAEQALAAVAFYVVLYLFMNLGAFAVVAFLRNELRSEEIADYAGLLKRAPGVVLLFSVILISLLGLPPLSGFVAKLMAFSALVEARLWLLLVIGGLNTAISLIYYLRVVKVMTVDPEPENRLPVQLSLLSGAGLFVVIITIPVVVLGVYFDQVLVWSRAATAFLVG